MENELKKTETIVNANAINSQKAKKLVLLITIIAIAISIIVFVGGLFLIKSMRKPVTSIVTQTQSPNASNNQSLTPTVTFKPEEISNQQISQDVNNINQDIDQIDKINNDLDKDLSDPVFNQNF